MIIEYHPEAVQEYEDGVDYYAEINPQLAAYFIKNIERCLFLIKESPTRWKEVRPNIRVLHTDIFPYQVLYMIKERRIIIIAIAHEKREPEYWTHRETGG